MQAYAIPRKQETPEAEPRTAYLVASGDLRESANRACWAAQGAMEEQLSRAIARLGWTVKRAHGFDETKGHGFIDSQRMGIEVMRSIPPGAPLVVAEAVWQYSHHVLAGLRSHRGPILTVANWSGQWPGLVGTLNLNGCLTKMGVAYSTLWSEDFTDEWFVRRLEQWLTTGRVDHDASHVHDLPELDEASREVELGYALAAQLAQEMAIIGVFDEGCMGMYNAIIEDELLNAIGIYKERLSQSALVAEMRRVSDTEAGLARVWLEARGMRFDTGLDESTDLTNQQVADQLKMYISAVRIAADFGCQAIGIQYQQGLKDMTPASDLAEGLLNNVDRPPVLARDGGSELYAGRALPHFNEVDEGCAVDALVTNRVWTAMGFDPATTLHDVRWGEQFEKDFVWVFMISGSVPPSHLVGGYSGAVSERQPPMYFPLGGGTIKGVSKPGEIVWSRVFVMNGALHADLGRGKAVDLPHSETVRRWQLTTPQWPIMHAVLHGVSRDQLMARHRANHIQVAYAPDPHSADRALTAKAAMLSRLGMSVHLCGDVRLSNRG
jgi:hypothetical protein